MRVYASKNNKFSDEMSVNEFVTHSTVLKWSLTVLFSVLSVLLAVSVAFYSYVQNTVSENAKSFGMQVEDKIKDLKETAREHDDFRTKINQLSLEMTRESTMRTNLESKMDNMDNKLDRQKDKLEQINVGLERVKQILENGYKK